MLRFTKVQVRSLSPRHLELSWEIAPTFEDVLDYQFSIQRSESPEGPWDYVSEAFEDKYLFIDSRVDIETRQDRVWYYRIEVTKKLDREVNHSPVVKRSADSDKIAAELRRQAQLRYQKVSGRLCWLFPVRTFGQRCPTCYDRVTGESQKANCPTCFNTTYARGYLDPIAIYVQFEPALKRSEAGGGIRREAQSGVMAHTGYYPIIKKADLIVEPENRRWLVDSVAKYERLRATVRQDLYVMEVELGSVHFDVPVNLEDLHSTEFSNPYFFQPKTSLGDKIVWR